MCASECVCVSECVGACVCVCVCVCVCLCVVEGGIEGLGLVAPSAEEAQWTVGEGEAVDERFKEWHMHGYRTRVPTAQRTLASQHTPFLPTASIPTPTCSYLRLFLPL